jgi:AcrR family transcriptional regulator
MLNAAQARIQDAALRLFAEKGGTQLTIRELAEAAGVARGTVYNNFTSVESLFNEVAARLATEMHERVVASFSQAQDPAERLANGVRFFVRRAHEEPHWARFVTRFALSEPALQGLWSGPPSQDIVHGIEIGRYEIRRAQVPAAVSFIAGSVLAAMFLVLEGHRTWRVAGTELVELVLCSLGVARGEARTLAKTELPPLPLAGGAE